MADLTPTELEALAKNTVATTENLKKLQDAMVAATEQAKKLFNSGEVQRSEALSAAAAKVAASYELVKASLSNLPFASVINELDRFSATTKDSGTGTEEFSRQIKDTSTSLLQNLAPGLDAIGRGFSKNIGLMALNKVSFLRDIVSPTKEYTSLTGSGGVFNGLNQSLKDVMETQNLARFNFMALGKSIQEADVEAEKFPERMRASARALGLSLEETNKYNASVKMIPDALKVANAALVNFDYLQNKNITISQLAQVGMKAWGLSSEEATRVQSTAFTNLNRSGESFINMLGEIHGAVKDSGVPFNIASQQILEASSSLGIFGKNADLATNIWKSFASTLSSSGVAVDAIGKIVNQVTTSISGMSVQNRAFIGMMSGMFQGATALGGALKMELAMRSPGGLEQGLEALTGSLAKFGGGKVITLEEAAQNPQLEMQFVLQRQMLGKLTNISSTEQQNRVLEVLQDVQRGGVSRIDGSKQLNDLMKRGTDVQANTVTAIEKLERTVGYSIMQSNKYLSFLPNTLAVLQRTGMGIRGGPRPGTTVTESPWIQSGAAQSIAQAGNLPGAKFSRDAGIEGLANDFSRAITTTIRNREQQMSPQQAPILSTSELLDSVRRGALGIGRRSAEKNLIPSEAPPATQTHAMILSGMSDERRTQLLTEIKNGMKPGTTPGLGPENIKGVGGEAQRGFGGTALAPEKLAAELRGIVGKTESTITIKVEAEQKFRQFMMDLLEKEVPKYVNGENAPER